MKFARRFKSGIVKTPELQPLILLFTIKEAFFQESFNDWRI
jgi:hypothetical protein